MKVISDNYPGPGPLGSTNPLNWRLDAGDEGRHVWHYIRVEDASYEALCGPDERNVKSRPQSEEAQYWLGLNLPPSAADHLRTDNDPYKAAHKGFEFYKRLQAEDGHWSGEYGGPMFLIPGMIITLFVTKTLIPEEWKIEITRYLANLQRSEPEDEGWGIHIEAGSSVFGTALNYVTLRLLGVHADHPMIIRARATLHKLGGAVGIPAWGKFWLSVLNVYEWEGAHPNPPEMWLLPEWIPFHPSRWWVQTRTVSIPMSIISSKKFKAEISPLILQLREELYVSSYETIDWRAQRNNISPADLYYPHHALVDISFAILGVYDKFAPNFIRQSGIDKCYQLVVMEDENTSYQTLNPVSNAMNTLVRWIIDGPDSDAFHQHIAKVRDFFWMSEKGMMMNGTNGSQLWDTGFITQALVDTRLAECSENKASCLQALKWIDAAQIREDPKWYKEAYRHSTKGAWPFSTREQGYTVSDCTAEGIKSTLMLQSVAGIPELVSKERLCDAVDLILGMQNPDGGFASYELVRGSKLLELLNPAEVFVDIMTEHTYPECSTSCVTALAMFQKQYPDYRKADINKTIASTIQYIKRVQRLDGSWYGSWGVCFTYAALFSIESLSLNGEAYDNSDSVKRACDFLISKQHPDGGWGESFKSCETHEYVQNEKSQVVNTAFVVLSLLLAKYSDSRPIVEGCRLIMSRQLPNGSWAQESIEGVFNHNCMISYPNFKFAFTIWALGKAARELPASAWAEV